MKPIRIAITILIAVIFLMGCASSAKKKDHRRNDNDLFNEGITYLNRVDAPSDYIKAKMTFEALVIAYPKSKWRNISAALIQVIDELQFSEEKNTQNRQIVEKLKTEKTRVAKEFEKCRMEASALTQENEKLKKDIQQLKNLELQLEKRRERSKR